MTGLTCRDVVELVNDYLQDALPPPVRQRFDAHLQGCEGCRVYLEQMRRTVEITGRLREDDVAPEAMAQLLHAFRRWRG